VAFCLCPNGARPKTKAQGIARSEKGRSRHSAKDSTIDTEKDATRQDQVNYGREIVSNYGDMTLWALRQEREAIETEISERERLTWPTPPVAPTEVAERVKRLEWIAGNLLGHSAAADVRQAAALLAQPADAKPVADDYKSWYDEAMRASNEAGYVGLDAATTIRELVKERNATQSADVVDAARYRWLRGKNEDCHVEHWVHERRGEHGAWKVISGFELDKVIDTALSQTQGRG
jgi:hypothetical protein